MAIGVLVDANILFSRTLRDWLFLLKFETSAIDLFRVYTSEDIVAEVLYRYRRAHPNAPGRLTKSIHDNINTSVDEVVTDFRVDGSYGGVDEDDAHVHAAALACKASILLTDDGGFALSESSASPYEVHTADSFFSLVNDTTQAAVRAVTAQQHAYWSERHTKLALDHALRAAGCPRFASKVAARMVNLLGLRAP